ncbi:DNA repair protein RAD51 homolog 4 isoform X2 [Selaginella moellendorffii]|uniref:DNA repair protein RAD51 homolog 4 isoform X2 n=1 Tax=Selaginella moellendorffii TaxID=88036 RepID=UPI000D1C684C|nr:DNA repair protein RAD51 homolog 4 isoform X2 [Selaginella moellendorffii]|eukprot:XP_024535226.1 DNA repair protein RAD51 homolog 4 isoform X2 [Selaginella moellendorffii]
MAPLRTLGFASLTPRVLEFLERNKIVTVGDFVSQELDSGVEDPEIQKFKSELATFLEECHGKWENGDEMLQKNLQAGSLSTGFESLDSLLKGGLKDGTITELVGPSSSGKTQLCMHSAACVAYHHKFSVAYVDASSSFSAERVLQMMCGRRCSSIAIEDDVKEAMRRIFCFKVYDVHGLLEVLHSLYDPASSFPGPVHLRLVIVDCLASVLSPILGGNNAQGHTLMMSVAQILKSIAINRNICVLITNNTVAAEDEELKPALGESWKSVPHVRLMLAKDHDNNSCTVTLLKHTSLACDAEVTFCFDRG